MRNNRNMKEWLGNIVKEKVKKPLPILAFPATSLMGLSVGELIGDPENQAKAMKLVAERIGAPAAMGFMDLSVEAECFGAEVVIKDDEVPAVVGQCVTTQEEAEALEVPQVGSCRSGIYIDAVKRASELITDRPVIAGVIGPFSLAARLMGVSDIIYTCYDEPEAVHTVLEKATEFIISYLRAFRDAGAGGAMMAEPVAGVLSPDMNDEFSTPYVKRINDAVTSDSFIMLYHNCGNNTPFMLDSILANGADAYHFGNSVDMRTMLDKIPSDVPVMGNVDPAAVLNRGTVELVSQKTEELLRACGEANNFIPSSGCDIPPMTPWENLDEFVRVVEEYYEGR